MESVAPFFHAGIRISSVPYPYLMTPCDAFPNVVQISIGVGGVMRAPVREKATVLLVDYKFSH